MQVNNTKTSDTAKSWIHRTLLGMSSALLIACGGGGGGAGDGAAGTTENTAPERATFEPSADKLLQEAENSGDLYVEQDFMFDHAKLTQLNLNVTDSEGHPHAYTRVKVYVVNLPSDLEVPEQWNDDLIEHASLISGGLTNANGDLVRLVEFPGRGEETQFLLLEVNAVGIENKTLIPVTSTRTNVSLGSI